MRKRDQRTVDDAPEIRLEKPTAVFVVDFVEPPIDGDTCIVRPRIDTAEALDRRLCDAFELRTIAHIRRNGNRFTSRGLDVLHDILKRFFAARCKHYFRALVRGSHRGRKPY